MSDETKKCPYCAETIQAAAIVCRYCGRDLAEKPVVAQQNVIDPAAPARKITGDTPGTWKCSRCGRALHPQAQGCAYCKQKFAAPTMQLGAASLPVPPPATKPRKLSIGVVVLVAVLGCMFLALIARFTGGSAGTASGTGALPTQVAIAKTAAPTEARNPTGASASTTTPAPTDPPQPTDTPEPAAAARAPLGITRRAAEVRYKDIGLTFTKSKLQDGRDRSLGSTDNSLINAEFIGPDANLEKISVFTAPTTDPQQNARAAVAMLTLLNMGVPNWSGAEDWILKNISELDGEMRKGETSAERKATVRGREVSLSFVDLAGSKLLFLSVEMAP